MFMQFYIEHYDTKKHSEAFQGVFLNLVIYKMLLLFSGNSKIKEGGRQKYDVLLIANPVL